MWQITGAEAPVNLHRLPHDLRHALILSVRNPFSLKVIAAYPPHLSHLVLTVTLPEMIQAFLSFIIRVCFLQHGHIIRI